MSYPYERAGITNNRYYKKNITRIPRLHLTIRQAISRSSLHVIELDGIEWGIAGFTIGGNLSDTIYPLTKTGEWVRNNYKGRHYTSTKWCYYSDPGLVDTRSSIHGGGLLLIDNFLTFNEYEMESLRPNA